MTVGQYADSQLTSSDAVEQLRFPATFPLGERHKCALTSELDECVDQLGRCFEEIDILPSALLEQSSIR